MCRHDGHDNMQIKTPWWDLLTLSWTSGIWMCWLADWILSFFIQEVTVVKEPSNKSVNIAARRRASRLRHALKVAPKTPESIERRYFKWNQGLRAERRKLARMAKKKKLQQYRDNLAAQQWVTTRALVVFDPKSPIQDFVTCSDIVPYKKGQRKEEEDTFYDCRQCECSANYGVRCEPISKQFYVFRTLGEVLYFVIWGVISRGIYGALMVLDYGAPKDKGQQGRYRTRGMIVSFFRAMILTIFLICWITPVTSVDTDREDRNLTKLAAFSGQKHDFSLWLMKFMAVATLAGYAAALKKNAIGSTSKGQWHIAQSSSCP